MHDDTAWTIKARSDDWGQFAVQLCGTVQGNVEWNMLGRFNAENAVAAIAAARHAGVTPQVAIEALNEFGGVRRRLEQRSVTKGRTVYDDFAHHPTAIQGTVAALRARVGNEHIAAILEPRSNTMKRGIHAQTLAASLAEADSVWMLRPPGLQWDMDAALAPLGNALHVFDTAAELSAAAAQAAPPGAHLLVMSNGGFDGIFERLEADLNTQPDPA